MTLPSERARAVLRAADFLRRVSNVFTDGGIKGIRREVRMEARSILRHFPLPCDIATDGSVEPSQKKEDIVARLEFLAENTTFLAARPAIREAADLIESLRREIAELRDERRDDFR